MKCVLHFIWLVRAARCNHLKKNVELNWLKNNGHITVFLNQPIEFCIILFKIIARMLFLVAKLMSYLMCFEETCALQLFLKRASPRKFLVPDCSVTLQHKTLFFLKGVILELYFDITSLTFPPFLS